MAFIVLSGFGLAILAPCIVRALKHRAVGVIALLPVGIFLSLLLAAPLIFGGEAFYSVIRWAPSLGLNLTFRLDGLGLLFSLLVSGIGALVVVYAGEYLKGRSEIGSFYLYFLLFMAAMLGVVLTDNLLALFVFWELTSITSYLLIGFDHEVESARNGALKALLITGSGGLAMLAGFVVLGQVAGTYEISKLSLSPATNAAQLTIALALILVGAFTKSAQWPFHIWLPDAMQAPTPVSAYLHSATMVKAGVYLLARLSPTFSDSPSWMYTVSIIGIVTMLAGGILALKQTDLKAILAYTTISWLGTLVMLLGWGSSQAVKAAMVGVMAHALYKGSLFLLVGGIDHETRTRDIRRLGGLWKMMPSTAILTGISALSMAGVPFFLGFIAKELLLDSALHSGYSATFAWMAPVIVVFASLMNVAIAWRLFHGIFFQKAPRVPTGVATRTPHDPPLAMQLGPLLLGALTVIFGTFPALVNSFVSSAAGAVLAHKVEVKLAVWHGINTPFLLSLSALVLGSGLYLIYAAVAKLIDRLMLPIFDRIYGGLVQMIIEGSQAVTRVIQNGTLRYYLMTILLTASLLIGYALLVPAGGIPVPQVGSPSLAEVLLSIALITTAIMITQAKGRLAAIAGLGVIGALIALFFVLFSAPDLALTQFIIETLMVIVFLLVFHFLPRFFEEFSSKAGRIRDFLISALVGITASGLVLFSTANHFTGPGISEYFIENSYILAHGTNVVNVILVDFRGIDTLGEITVLVIAATGIYAMLKFRIFGRSTTERL